MALGGGRKPRVFHSYQGCQFTSSDYVERMRKDKIQAQLGCLCVALASALLSQEAPSMRRCTCAPKVTAGRLK